jgi:hypothetical protein
MQNDISLFESRHFQFQQIFPDTVKPVLKGHLWEGKKWPYKTGELIRQITS